MVRIIAFALAVVITAICGYYIITLSARVERQRQRIEDLRVELAAARDAVGKARETRIKNESLYRLLIAIADHARPGSPIDLMRYDEKFQTLTSEEIKEIATLLNSLTPREGNEAVRERFNLSEYQVRVLTHLLRIPDRLQKDAPGYAEFELEPLRGLTLTNEGLGPITLGTRLDEASEILDIDFKASPFSYGGDRCYSTAVGTDEYQWLLRFIAVHDRIGVIDIYGPGIATDRGIDVASTMREAMAAYPEGRMFGAHDPSERVWHVPLAEDRYLAFTGSFVDPGEPWNDEDGEGHIRAITLGRPGVGSVEGCL